MNVILGAGLSGLICGALNATARIYERNDAAFVEHRAVLRFRDDKIARALGLNFRRVTVRKAIWYRNREYSTASPRFANWYSLKVRDVVTENSVWNLSSSERFIAPDDLHARLAEICGNRVQWKHTVSAAELDLWRLERLTVVSTIPIPLLLQLLSQVSEPLAPPALAFVHAPITVTRYTVPNCDVHQTVYFPDPELGVYRATLTGALLTIEGQGAKALEQHELDEVREAFGLTELGLKVQMISHKQSFGKIAPVPNGPRSALLHQMTTRYGIYSLGRFATWRNILLDDVYEDIAAIRKMMTLTQYEVNLERTKDES